MAKRVTTLIRCDKCGKEINETGKMEFRQVDLYFCHPCAVNLLWCALNDAPAEKRKCFIDYYENRDGKV